MPFPFTFLTYIPLLDWDKKKLERETTSTPNFQQYRLTLSRDTYYTPSANSNKGDQFS